MTLQLTRQRIRATRRYEHPSPGDLLHLGGKKIGKIPPGGGCCAYGRSRRPGSVAAWGGVVRP